MNQDWRDLTFLHWATDPRLLQRFMPPGVRPDTFQGHSYVGLIPIRMVNAGFRRGPGVPWAGTFLETNVRLYSVDETGRRGIVFLSLDTNRSLVVAGARLGFGLPYRWARMRHTGNRRWSAPLRCPVALARSPRRKPDRYPGRRPAGGHRPRHVPHRTLGTARAPPRPHLLRAQRPPPMATARRARCRSRRLPDALRRSRRPHLPTSGPRCVQLRRSH